MTDEYDSGYSNGYYEGLDQGRDDARYELRDRIAVLEAALKPFADAADDFIAEKHDAHRAIVTLGDLRAAAAALKETGDE